jgi:hypothetical protein
VGHVAHTGERRGTFKVLVVKIEGKRPLGRPRHRWESNIKIYVKQIGWEGLVGFIQLKIGKTGGLL